MGDKIIGIIVDILLRVFVLPLTYVIRFIAFVITVVLISIKIVHAIIYNILKDNEFLVKLFTIGITIYVIYLLAEKIIK